MIRYIQTILSYDKSEKLRFLSKRLGGAWLIWIGIVLILSMATSASELVNQTVFSLGYGLGLFLFFGVKPIRRFLSFGPPSLFQRKMALFSIIFMFVLMFLIGGPFYATMDYRMIWLGALMADFIPFYYVHGKTMLFLSPALILVVGAGYINPDIPFAAIGDLDVLIKIAFGIGLLFSKKMTVIGGSSVC
jgi:hypothetical protein